MEELDDNDTGSGAANDKGDFFKLFSPVDEDSKRKILGKRKEDVSSMCYDASKRILMIDDFIELRPIFDRRSLIVIVNTMLSKDDAASLLDLLETQQVPAVVNGGNSMFLKMLGIACEKSALCCIKGMLAMLCKCKVAGCRLTCLKDSIAYVWDTMASILKKTIEQDDVELLQFLMESATLSLDHLAAADIEVLIEHVDGKCMQLLFLPENDWMDFRTPLMFNTSKVTASNLLQAMKRGLSPTGFNYTDPLDAPSHICLFLLQLDKIGFSASRTSLRLYDMSSLYIRDTQTNAHQLSARSSDVIERLIAVIGSLSLGNLTQKEQIQDFLIYVVFSGDVRLVHILERYHMASPLATVFRRPAIASMRKAGDGPGELCRFHTRLDGRKVRPTWKHHTMFLFRSWVATRVYPLPSTMIVAHSKVPQIRAMDEKAHLCWKIDNSNFCTKLTSKRLSLWASDPLMLFDRPTTKQARKSLVTLWAVFHLNINKRLPELSMEMRFQILVSLWIEWLASCTCNHAFHCQSYYTFFTDRIC